jgi:diguanylate cyclase (GGDEF)-like protein
VGARVFIGAVVAVAAALLAWAIPPAVRFATEAPSGFWAISLMAVLVDVPFLALARGLGEPPRATLSVSFTFAIFLVWGAAPAIVVQAVAAAAAGLGQRRGSRVVFLVARLVCALAAAEVAVGLTGVKALDAAGSGLTGHDLAGFLVPAVVWFSVSFGLLVLARGLLRGGTLRTVVAGLRDDLLATAASLLLLSPLLTATSGWWTALVAAPVLAWNQLSREYTRREQRLRHEPVTGVLNRRGLILAVDGLTADDVLGPERQRPFGVVLFNVEAVLAINRALGREVYERVVSAVAQRLATEFGAYRVGRLSGEGFVLLAPGMTDEDAEAEAARGVAALTSPIEVDGIPFAIDPAAGVALSPPHGRDFATLVSKAELAMGEARRRGERVMVYVRQAREHAQRRIAILREVRAALRDPARRDEVAVVYQPQVDVRTGRLAGAEALVRWDHPGWGPVPVDELIGAVERSEIMHLLTLHVLDRAIGQARAWNDAGLRVRVAVNASAQDLHDADFPAQILRLLSNHGVAPDRLTIEITERMLVDDTGRVARGAARIAELGVGLSLDDFGTGFASIQQLRLLPLSEVKIDKSYVSGMTRSGGLRAIVTSVHQLARALHMSVVAEGVEDGRTAAALARLPGTVGQGWHFGRPMPAGQFEQRWLPAAARPLRLR